MEYKEIDNKLKNILKEHNLNNNVVLKYDISMLLMNTYYRCIDEGRNKTLDILNKKN